MSQETTPHMPHVGLRNIKTALSATLCAALYTALGHNPTFACIGAIFSMGNDLNASWRSGANRLLGTVLGGFLGIALYWLYLPLAPHGGTLWLLPLLFLGVVILIVCAQLFHWPTAVQPGGVVMCIILFNTPADSYVVYAISRLLDTGVGVLMSLAINLLLPRERLDRWLLHWQTRRKAG